jgi:hypothetical protein
MNYSDVSAKLQRDRMAALEVHEDRRAEERKAEREAVPEPRDNFKADGTVVTSAPDSPARRTSMTTNYRMQPRR